MQRKTLEGASDRADRKLRTVIASREPGKRGRKATDAEVARAAAESQHHALAWLADLTGAALR